MENNDYYSDADKELEKLGFMKNAERGCIAIYTNSMNENLIIMGTSYHYAKMINEMVDKAIHKKIEEMKGE